MKQGVFSEGDKEWVIKVPYAEYYSIQDAARILGVGSTQVYSYIERETLPAYLVEGTKSVKHDDLVAYIEQRLANGPTTPVGERRIVRVVPNKRRQSSGDRQASAQTLRSIVQRPALPAEPAPSPIPTGGLDLETLKLDEE